MWDFLNDLFSDPSRNRDVIILDEDGLEEPKRHHVNPGRLTGWWVGSILIAITFGVLLIAFTPLRTVIIGADTEDLRQEARMNNLRVQALQDTLAAYQEYQNHLQRLVTGEVDTSQMNIATERDDPATTENEGQWEGVLSNAQSESWQDHEQPAYSADRLEMRRTSETESPGNRVSQLPSLQFPVLPPVEGFVTRSFDPRSGHYALDIAVQEGTPVRSIGDGYVIMSDWTQEGGHTISIQHADGYVSVYKHNSRLLKQVGDRVSKQEEIALSGSSGEVTTGPHLHVEIWRNGLAQDPEPYFVLQ